MSDLEKDKNESVIPTARYGGLGGIALKELEKKLAQEQGDEVIVLGGEEQINQTTFIPFSKQKK